MTRAFEMRIRIKCLSSTTNPSLALKPLFVHVQCLFSSIESQGRENSREKNYLSEKNILQEMGGDYSQFIRTYLLGMQIVNEWKRIMFMPKDRIFYSKRTYRLSHPFLRTFSRVLKCIRAFFWTEIFMTIIVLILRKIVQKKFSKNMKR